MKNIVHFGFSAIILITTLLIFVWLEEIKSSNETVLSLIEQYDQKIAYANTMNNAIRNRQILLLRMLVINDPFELDKHITRFYEEGNAYLVARQALHELPLSEDEKQLHDLIDKRSLRSQPETVRAAEMFRERQPRDKIVKVLKSAAKYQSELLETLDHFVALQASKDDVAAQYSHKMFDNSVYWISILGFIAFIVSVVISRYVAKSVAEKNQKLLESRAEMEKAYKKAEEATIIKSEFLATMSHEIRTPLTAIIGFAETMLFKEQTVFQRLAATKTIIRSGKHLLQIINDILDLSKIEANKLIFEEVELSLFELLADIKHLVQPAAEEKDLGFSINYIFPLPEVICSDPLRIKQVLINLCNNAIKFTEKGYVIINVSCDIDAGRLNFEVVDSGVGINKEQQEIIFQAYQQADSTTTRKFGGTGLGLSLSRTLAENLGGTITVCSEPGKGSQFKFSLNIDSLSTVDLVYDKKHLSKIKEYPRSEYVSKELSGTVLLAEDNKDNQDLLKIYIKRMGANVVMVDNGQLAVDAALNGEFNLVLMDMRMPVMGGLEAVKILRKKGYTKPVVALTANAMHEDKNACELAGCDDFISKPVDVNVFSEILERYLEVKKSVANSELQVKSLTSTLLEEDPDIISLIKRFIDKLPATMTEIENLIETQHWEELSDTLHQLKGTGGNFGFPELSDIAGKMEFQALNKNSGEVITLFTEMKNIYQQILSGFKEC